MNTKFIRHTPAPDGVHGEIKSNSMTKFSTLQEILMLAGALVGGGIVVVVLLMEIAK